MDIIETEQEFKKEPSNYENSYKLAIRPWYLSNLFNYPLFGSLCYFLTLVDNDTNHQLWKGPLLWYNIVLLAFLFAMFIWSYLLSKKLIKKIQLHRETDGIPDEFISMLRSADVKLKVFYIFLIIYTLYAIVEGNNFGDDSIDLPIILLIPFAYSPKLTDPLKWKS